MSNGKVTIGEAVKRYSKGVMKMLPTKKLKGKKLKGKKLKGRKVLKKSVVTVDLRPKEIKKEKQYAFKEEEIGTKNILFRNSRRGE